MALFRSARPLARGFVVLFSIACLVGCTTTETMVRPAPATVRERLEPGDSILVVLADGQRLRTAIRAITDEKLVTGAAAYPWQDIAAIEQSHVKVGRTALLALAILGILAYYAVRSIEIHPLGDAEPPGP